MLRSPQPLRSRLLARALSTLPFLLACSRAEITPSPVPSESARAKPSPSAAPSVETHASFSVVDVLDFARHEVHNFAFCTATDELFVSFTDRLATDPIDALQQWNVGDAKVVHTYLFEPGWIVDSLFPSPDGRRVLVALYRHGAAHGARFETYALLDAETHRIVRRDLEPFDARQVDVEFSVSGDRFRIAPSAGHVFEYDAEGARSSSGAAAFPAHAKGKLRVIESSKATLATHGLYYTDPTGTEHRVTDEQWHENHGLTNDERFVVTTTWSGDLLAFSTTAKQVVFKTKIASAYGYLASDPKRNRFLIGDATHDGTTHLRAFVRVH